MRRVAETAPLTTARRLEEPAYAHKSTAPPEFRDGRTRLDYTQKSTPFIAPKEMPSLKTTPDEIVRWLGLRFRVPCDWQMVRHSKNPEKGSVVFVDRRRERLEVHWQDCSNEPDLERMVDNQRSLAKKQDPEAHTEFLRGLGNWRGLRTQSKGAVLSRAVRFDPKTQRLVDLVVSSSEDEDVSDFFPWFCRHVEVEAKGPDALRWACFDIDLTMPEGYRLRDADIKPCDASLEFEEVEAEGEARVRRRIRVRRLGLVDSWYTGDPAGLLRAQSPKLRFNEFTQLTEGTHPATEGRAVEPTTLIPRLAGRQVHARVRLWHCEPENALYEVTCSGYRSAPNWPTDLKVHCRPHDHDPGSREA